MRGFVDERRGEVRLRHVLIPVDHEPKPTAAIDTIMGFARLIAGIDAEERLLHVGASGAGNQATRDAASAARRSPLRKGDAVDAIVDVGRTTGRPT